VLSGVLVRYPDLRILTHHGGGMIPTFGQRVGPNAIGFQGQEHASELDAFSALPKSPQEYFKLFYADTTVGAVPRTLRASIDFFGVDHVLFASDWPYGPPTEEANLTLTLAVLKDRLDLTQPEVSKLLGGNAQRVLGLS
jgi:aminocarboxymuconate-semialdehyde decarboxylase